MNGKDYVLASIDHEASQPWKKDSEFAYTNRFTCTPFDVPFRPVRQNPKPFVRGAQTAIVVGPKGEEIYTDEHGRVKVQFHWDREGKKDDNSSCWIRVSQVWAGGGWGAIHIPRIGQEVIVDFLEGDPDRPIITGRVYNASQTPPYGLPANATQSGLRSRSSKGGSADNYNEIRMEDKKGAEQILVHAERNMDTSVEVDESLDVGGNRKVHVKGSFTENIDSGETRTVNAGAKETINGGMTQTINGGEIRTVNGGVTESINGGETRTINGGATETIVGGETRTVSGGLTETINGAFTQTSSSGATISSPGAITIKGDGGVNIIAAGGTKIIDTALASFGGSRLEFYDAQNKVLIENAQVTAIKTDVVLTLSTGIAMNKIDRAGFVSKKEGAKFTEELINIGKATQRILDAGLTMIGL
jgi:type VI secretion system secreted protein VgrG